MSDIVFNLVFILFFLNITLIHSAFAESKGCSLNGQWFEANGTPVYALKQKGTLITMEENIVHPVCGTFKIEGTSDGHQFSFKFSMSNTKEIFCRTWILFTGSFTSADCTKIGGKMITHLEVLNPPDNELSSAFSWYRNIVKIVSPDPSDTFIITAEPKMPVFKAVAILENHDAIGYLSKMTTINYKAPPFAWNVRIKHSPIPCRLDFDVFLDEVTSNESIFTPNFNLLKTADNQELVDGGIMGGELTLSVEYYKAMRDDKKYIIKGTNPGQAAIERILTDSVTRHIACQESRYKQFEANREGGVGFPVIGLDPKKRPIGGAGIMQLYFPRPRPGQVWSWKENLKAGVKYFNKKMVESKHAHIKETIRLNKERQAMGLPLCPKHAIIPLDEEQLNRETIRRYNCGREYRWEPRDAPNCEGRWIYDLSCKREEKEGYDPIYVDKVLNCNIDD